MTTRSLIALWAACAVVLFGRPIVAGPLPKSVTIDGVRSSSISLDGTWKFTLDPPTECWLNEVSPDAWDEITVPGDVFAQGFPIRQDKPYAYKRRIEIPVDFAGHRIMLRFQAVSNRATVFVDGKRIMTHQGGFTPWECDITAAVTPGTSTWITVEGVDRSDDISMNGKAQRPIGGIFQSVSLEARPRTHFEYPIVATPFDDAFTNAVLHVRGTVAVPNPSVKATFRLMDPQGAEVPLEPRELALDAPLVTFKAPVPGPVTWDAEHPRLYRLEITTVGGGQPAARYFIWIGFRDIRFDARNNLLVNGRIVKLRGANRHLVNPTGGKTPTAEYDRADVELAKDANINFFRTSHYPPGEGLVVETDRQGVYVAVESAIVNVGKGKADTTSLDEPTERGTRNAAGKHEDPDEAVHFLSQLQEMLLTYGSHPSVIIWSTANESLYGRNFLESYALCKRVDPSRPVVASYQVREDAAHESYDIKSHHYPRWDSDFTSRDLPVLFDEWIHVLGHSAQDWFHDPNARDYWGRGLDIAWAKAYEADGCLGGAIWNFIDDVLYLPDPLKKTTGGPQRFVKPGQVRMHTPVARGNVFGVARWGIIDEWRRRKPEFWNTKKAYSPLRLLATSVPDFKPGQPVLLPVYNRFDHTDLAEITMRLTAEGRSWTQQCPPLPPRQKGTLSLMLPDLAFGTEVLVEFLDAVGNVIDADMITLGTKPPAAAAPPAHEPVTLHRTASVIRAAGKECAVEVNPRTGFFTTIEVHRAVKTFSGPFPHLFSLLEQRDKTTTYDGPDRKTWELESLDSEIVAGVARIRVNGTYESVRATLEYDIDGGGTVVVKYRFSPLPALADDLRTSRHAQALEAGIQFTLDDGYDELSWKRTGYWSWYPPNHLSALAGTTPLFRTQKPSYRQPPGQDWEQDAHDWMYQGVNVPEGKLLTNISRAAKSGIEEYTLGDSAANMQLRVIGDGRNTSARFTQLPDGTYSLAVMEVLNYHLRWGNYVNATQRPQETLGGQAVFQIGVGR